MTIEAKKFKTPLGNHTGQLHRYFGPSDAKIAILTNGNDYWFFTDGPKQNIMDIEPYFKLKITGLNNHDIIQLYEYRKKKMIISSTVEIVKVSKFRRIWSKYWVRLLAKIVGFSAIMLIAGLMFKGYIPAPLWIKVGATLTLFVGAIWVKAYSE